jgi:hypothetical protein
VDVTVGSVFEVIKGVAEAFSGKSMTLTSDRVSTRLHKCNKKECPWQQQNLECRLIRKYNWPFKSWGAAELWVRVLFEYDGCDVHNARLVPCSKSYNKWYNDKSTFVVVATGALSKFTRPSGCKACCTEAALITFDVAVDVLSDYLRTQQRFFEVTIAADGFVGVQEL